MKRLNKAWQLHNYKKIYKNTWVTTKIRLKIREKIIRKRWFTTVCSYRVMYLFQSEYTLKTQSKELLARNRCEFWNLSDCNRARTHNHLVCKRTLNHLAKLAKWLSCVVSTYLYDAFDCMFLSCHALVSEWIHTLKFPKCQGAPYSKQAQILKFKWVQQDSNPQPLSS